MSETVWKPIEEAPKDGTSVLLASPKANGKWRIWSSDGWRVRLRYIHEDPRGYWVGQGSRNDPTHWRPLPAPPEGDG